ncbi:type III secretion system translocon subunit SctE [Paraburkholderia sp. RL17-373-BIF-A]|uniref:type III secretion system translocon subunit SctE n=1 Tax=Paraburkholderia sp. RL17-373-BIF-A TaxID=3031629 RepID=UPI0038BD8BD7
MTTQIVSSSSAGMIDMSSPLGGVNVISSPPIGAGALTPIVRRQPHEQPGSNQARWASQVPSRPTELVTVRAAEAALNRILSTFGATDGGKPITVAQIEHTPMAAMTLASALLGVKALGDVAQLKSFALEIRTQGVEKLRERQIEALRVQIDKSIEDEQKAKAAAVFNVIADWIISVAEVATGGAKLVCGDFAGGTMDIAAGCAGLVKAIVETVALGADDKAAAELREIADIAGKIQLSFEIAGMCVDVISIARVVAATKVIAKGTETVMKRDVGEALRNIVMAGRNAIGTQATKEMVSIAKSAAKDAIASVSEEVAEQVARQVAKEVEKGLAESGLRFMGQSHLIAAFGEEAIKKIVQNAVQTVAGNALRDVGALATTELTKQVVNMVRKDVTQRAVRSCMMSNPNVAKAAIRGGVQGANAVGMGEISKDRAELQKTIQQLTADSSFVQFLLDEFEKLKQRAREDMSHLLDGAGKSLSSAAEAQNKNNVVLSNIAHNIA